MKNNLGVSDVCLLFVPAAFEYNPSELFCRKIWKMPIRFSAAQDILLLKEVLAIRPANLDGWKAAATRLSAILTFKVEARTVRERTERLMKQYKQEDVTSLRRCF